MGVQTPNTPKQDVNIEALLHEQDCAGWEETGLSSPSGSHVFGLPGSFKYLLLPLQGRARSGKGAEEGQRCSGYLLVR